MADDATDPPRKDSLRWRNRVFDLLATALVAAAAAGLFAAAVALARVEGKGSIAAASLGLLTLVAAGLRGFELWLCWNSESSVAWIRQNKIEINEGAALDRRALRALGGRRSLVMPHSWTLRYADDRDLGRLLGKLRDLGLGFVRLPYDWAPAQVFELLRDRGLVEGRYRPF